MTRLNAANNAQALLVGDITAAATSFYVDDASVFPAAPFLISIDDEIMKVGTVLGNLLSDIDRAQEGTIAAAHVGDSLVENRWTAGMYAALASLADVPKNNFSATTNPGVGDDTGEGYSVGSTWINVSADTAYVCLDATAGAAVWEKISGLAAHLADEATAHGATAARTASKILLRDASGFAPANGVSFPATQVPSADANTLDDYEEGTWTGAFTAGTSGTITINAGYATGRYTKIGRLVTLQGYFYIDSVSSPVGELSLTGLPFAAATPTAGFTAVTIFAIGLNATGATQMQGSIPNGGSIIAINHFAAGVSAAAAGDVKAGSSFAINCTYSV